MKNTLPLTRAAALTLVLFTAACHDGPSLAASGAPADASPEDFAPDGLVLELQQRQRTASDAYLVTALDGELVGQARNMAEGLDIRFWGWGPSIEVGAPSYTLGLELTGFGRGDDVMAAPAVARRHVDGFDVRYARAGIVEWYRNGPVGLEQGFELTTRPDGQGPLRLVVAPHGNLMPEQHGEAVVFRDGHGRERARYGHLYVSDADGHEVRSHIALEEGAIVLVLDDAGATYPLAVDPFVWTETTKLVASDAAQGAFFGRSGDLSGDGLTAVIGAYWDPAGGNEAGAAYVFALDGSWGEQAKLVSADLAAEDNLGESVGIADDGATVIVGAPGDDDDGADSGSAYIFTRTGNTWPDEVKLVAADAAAGDRFGEAVALSGDGATAIVTAPGAGADGAAYVFLRNGNVWSEQAKLVPASPGDGSFGAAVDLSDDGNVAIVAAPDANLVGTAGDAFIFARNGTTWTEQAKLTPADGMPGDFYGRSVAISGDGSTALVGADDHEVGGVNNAGAGYVYASTGGTWAFQEKITHPMPSANDSFGVSVALSATGDIAVLGSIGDDKSGGGAGQSDGSAVIFRRTSDQWAHEETLFGADTTVLLGEAVALSNDGRTVMATDAYNSVNIPTSGAAYIFNGVPAPLGAACNTEGECDSGFCVDGVCCDSVCGGGATDDCEACSAALTGAAEGTCAPVSDGSSCDDGDACTGGDVCSAGICGGDDICGQGGMDGGGGSSGVGAGGANPPGNEGDVDADGGCSCRVPVGSDGPSERVGWLALLALGLFARRRLR